MTDSFLPFTEAAVRELTTAADHMAVADFLHGILARAPLAGSRNLYGAHRMILGCLATELTTLASDAGEPSHLTPREQERAADRLDRLVDDGIAHQRQQTFDRRADVARYGTTDPTLTPVKPAAPSTQGDDLSWLG